MISINMSPFLRNSWRYSPNRVFEKINFFCKSHLRVKLFFLRKVVLSAVVDVVTLKIESSPLFERKVIWDFLNVKKCLDDGNLIICASFYHLNSVCSHFEKIFKREEPEKFFWNKLCFVLQNWFVIVTLLLRKKSWIFLGVFF